MTKGYELIIQSRKQKKTDKNMKIFPALLVFFTPSDWQQIRLILSRCFWGQEETGLSEHC